MGLLPNYAVGSELLNSTQLNNIGGSFVDDNNGFLDISTGRNSGNIPISLSNSPTASASQLDRV